MSIFPLGVSWLGKKERSEVKKILIIAAVIGMASANAQSVLVRNKPVDLAPVVKWLADRNGERPMPHWKVIEIEKIVGKGWGGYEVAAKVDGKSKSDMVIQNIPAELLRVIAQDDATLKAMADIEARILAVERQIREVERTKELTIREASNAYEISVALLRAHEETLAGLQFAHSRLADTLLSTTEAKKSKFLAYQTGQKVGKLEVWDCGIGAKLLSIQGLE